MAQDLKSLLNWLKQQATQQQEQKKRKKKKERILLKPSKSNSKGFSLRTEQFGELVCTATGAFDVAVKE